MKKAQGDEAARQTDATPHFSDPAWSRDYTSFDSPLPSTAHPHFTAHISCREVHLRHPCCCHAVQIKITLPFTQESLISTSIILPLNVLFQAGFNRWSTYLASIN
jgi:hypothetical protein